ncbi:MAG: hypothetical protein EHM80_11985 [Nitrospiraceae bacterium]|nr:MAG: hypothetical protein EHM80_11985 [Nitrospiraceae bacterium]
MACTPFVEHTTTCWIRDDPDTKPERLPCQSGDSLKQEPAVVLCDTQNAALQKEAGVGAAGTVGSIARGRRQHA